MRNKLILAVSILLLSGGVYLAISDISKRDEQVRLNDIKLLNTSSQLKFEQRKAYELNVKLNDTSSKTDAEKAQLEKEIEERKAREAELEAQLQAKLEQKRQLANAATKVAQTATGTAVAAAAPSPSVGNCGDNMYKQYIYQHESGCNTGAVNSIGCTGIGQACPASKIAHCGTSFACQDAWFTNYAVSRYGSWAGAYQFWLQNHWW